MASLALGEEDEKTPLLLVPDLEADKEEAQTTVGSESIAALSDFSELDANDNDKNDPGQEGWNFPFGKQNPQAGMTRCS